MTHHGIVAPLFSLRSEKHPGIGTYLDLLPLVDWCQEVGMDVIQLLPLNDPGLDSSPYNAISSNALAPIYLSLPDGNLRKYDQSERVHYQEVRELKLQLLTHKYLNEREEVTSSRKFLEFVQKNEWLDEYALFKILKMGNDWHSWETWDLEIRNITEEKYQELLHEHHEEILFQKYLQFLCFSQMMEVKSYANARGVKIMGDIPILINADSEEVWYHREYFSLDFRAGCPPDKFNREGQYWGFPLFRWDVMKKDGYAWWKERIQTAAQIYDIYRLDHVVGFFRIWGIEEGKLPMEGHYLPRDHKLWPIEGRERLEKILKFSDMLPIGEDLGTIPHYVPKTLYELGIPGTVILPWARKEPHPCTLMTVSTHDTPTLNLWWRNYPQEATRFAEKRGWSWTPELTKEQRIDILRESHHSKSLYHVNLLQEYLALEPHLTWNNIELERVNFPGILSDRNWSVRLPVTVETIASDPKLKDDVQAILSPRRLHLDHSQ